MEKNSSSLSLANISLNWVIWLILLNGEFQFMNKFGLFLPHWWSKYFSGLYKMMLLQWKNWQSSSFSFRFHDLIQLMINFISINCFLQRVVKDVCTQNWRLPCSSEVVRLNKIWLSSKICIRYSAMEFLRETYDIINLKVEIFKIIYKDFFIWISMVLWREEFHFYILWRVMAETYS